MKPKHVIRNPWPLPGPIQTRRDTLGSALSFAIAAAFPWLSLTANASLTSANYRIEPVAFGGGASQSGSANVSSFSGVAGFVVGTSASSDYTAHYGFFPGAGPVDVTGRFVFYNQSAWDGNSAAANANDDNAVAPDKRALLPGGTATFANYTSYSRGINGIMVDLPNGAAPAAADFTFKRGNNNTPAGWAGAPAPSSITVRAGAGVGGADRVTLIWPNNQIQKEWLEVTVLSTANTGLATPDSFYFGNAIGETGVGNTATRFPVTSADLLPAIDGPILSGAPITAIADHNRDRRVISVDVLISVAHVAVGSAALIKLNLGGGDLPVPGDVLPGGRVALADVEDHATAPGFLGRPRILGNGIHLWVTGSPGMGGQLEHTSDLRGDDWKPLSADWVVEHGQGVYELVLPVDAPQRFLRFRPFATPVAD